MGEHCGSTGSCGIGETADVHSRHSHISAAIRTFSNPSTKASSVMLESVMAAASVQRLRRFFAVSCDERWVIASRDGVNGEAGAVSWVGEIELHCNGRRNDAVLLESG